MVASNIFFHQKIQLHSERGFSIKPRHLLTNNIHTSQPFYQCFRFFLPIRVLHISKIQKEEMLAAAKTRGGGKF